MTLPRQDQRPKPRNGPPAAAEVLDPAVSNPAGLRIHEQTVLGWMLNPANHDQVTAHLTDVEIRHFYSPAHQEIYAAITVHAGAPNIATLVAVDLTADTTHRSVRALPGGLAVYLSECREYADLLDERSLAYSVRIVREAHTRRRRFEIHGLATKALEADDLDGYHAAHDAMRALGDSDDGSAPVDDPFPPIDWDEAFGLDFTHMDWLSGRFMERGQQATLVGDGKVGKSLFVLDWAFRAVTGRSFIGDERRDPITVLYFDRENSLRDIITRATAFGATADDFRGRLSYRQFPRFSGALDESERAAREFLTIVDHVGPDVVVLDTASRFIAGKENESDTWLQLYRLIHAPLKARGVACVRLDHFGKDSDRGSRGSSAKTQDVDHVWEMRRLREQKGCAGGVDRIATTIRMSRTHTRSGLGEDEFVIVRRGERRVGGMWLPGRTGHELADLGVVAEIRSEVDVIADGLIAAGVPAGLGRDRLKAWMTERKLPTHKDTLMGDVVRRLRERQS